MAKSIKELRENLNEIVFQALQMADVMESPSRTKAQIEDDKNKVKGKLIAAGGQIDNFFEFVENHLK